MRRAKRTRAERLAAFERAMAAPLPRLDDLDRLARGETGFVLQPPLCVYPPVGRGTRGPAMWLTAAYLREDKRALHEAWRALTDEEQSAVCRGILAAAVTGMKPEG